MSAPRQRALLHDVVRWLQIAFLAAGLALGAAAVQAFSAPSPMTAACNGWPSSGGVPPAGHDYQDFTSGSNTWSNGHLRTKLPTSYTCSAWIRTYTYNAISIGGNARYLWIRMMTTAGGTTNCNYVGSGTDYMRDDGCSNADFNVIGATGISQNTTYTNFGIGYASCSTNYGAQVGWTTNHEPGANCGTPATRWPDGGPPKFDWTAPSAPTVAITPGTKASVNGTTIYVNGTVASSFTSGASASTDSGGSGLAGYSHTLTGTTTGWSPTSSTTASQAFSWTAAITSGQTTTLTVRSRDTAGNTSSGVVRTIISDETAPVATFAAPSAGTAFIKVTSFTTTITVSDAPSGVASWSLARQWAAASSGACGTTWTADGTIASGTTAVTSQNNAQTLVNARCYRWVLTATDKVGIVTSATSGSVFVDTTPPAVDFTTPNEGTTTTIPTGNYSVAWTETETGSGITVRSTQRQRGPIVTPGTCTGVTPANDGAASPSTSPISVTGLLGGYCYRWILTVTDAATNQGVGTSGWVIVASGPQADFTTPDEPLTVRQSATSYTVAWTETGGVTTRSLQRQRGPIVTPGSCAGVAWANDGSAVTAPSPVVSSGLLDGFCYRWIQTVGNGTTSAPFTSGMVLVDSTTPVTAFTSPAANSAQSATQTTLAWTEGDNGTGISARFLQRQFLFPSADGSCLGFDWNDEGSPSTTATSPFAVSGLFAGRCYRWQLTLIDGVGNTSWATSPTILIDNSAAIIDFATPNEATTTVQSAGGILVAWSESGAARVNTRSIQRQSTTVTAGACGTTWVASGPAVTPTTTTSTSLGLAANTCYRWVLSTTDVAGNPGTATSGTIRVSESVLPNTIANQSMFATQTLSAQTSLGSVTNVQFLIDGVVVGSDASSPYSAAINMLTQSNGTHQLAVRVTQTGGATTTSPNTQIVVANALNSKGRLAADFAVGLLTLDDWVLNGVLSIGAPNALPARYRSTAPYPDAEGDLGTYVGRRSEMTPSGQAALDAFLGQPFRGDLYQPTANLGGPAPGYTGCGLTRTTPAGNGYPSFTVTYCEVTSRLAPAPAPGAAPGVEGMAPTSTGPNGCCHFKFDYVIGPATTANTVEGDDDGSSGGFAGNGIPDIVDRAMVTFEEVYTYYRDVLHLKEPLTGNETISVQLAAGGPSGNQANRTIFGSHIDVDPSANQRFFGYAIPHELLHIFEFGYRGGAGPFDDHGFWIEAAANWGAHQWAHSKGLNFDPENTWTGDVGAYLGTSQLELSAKSPNGEQREYAVNLLAQYMTERFGAAEPVKRTWELLESGQGGKQSIVSAVNEQPGASFEAFFMDYAQVAYQMSLSDPDLPAWLHALEDYAKPARHPVGDPLYTGPDDLGNDRPHRHRAEPSLNNDVSGELELGELGMGYIDIKPIFAGQPGQVTVRVQRPDDKVRARWVWYRLLNPADPAQGTSVCGVPVDITFNNNEGFVTQNMTNDCFFGTLMVTRIGGAGFAPFGSKIEWTTTVGVGIISNGTVQLGVGTMGNIDVPGGTPSTGTQDTYVGLRLVASNYDGLAPDCDCEGWGVSNGTTSGWVSEELGNVGITVESFTATTNTARSQVVAAGNFRVVHQFDPVPGTPNLYRITVSVTNIGGAPATLLYRRTMDWDVEPTAFEEYVTIGSFGAVPSELVYTDNNGFATPDPLEPGPGDDLGAVGMFVDFGPDDTGARFDFNFGSLGVNQTKTFSLFYGAAPNEATALSSLQAVGAVVYSLGEPSNPGGSDLGQPVTFFFGYKP